MAELTFAEISKLLKYDPETGKLYWLERPVEMFPSARVANTWNSRFSGKEAFTAIDARGYVIGNILNKSHSGHRVCWLLHTGRWPEKNIDHINGNRADNRIENLRDVTRSQNQRNQTRRATNKSGFGGVFWDNRSQRWHAKIKIGGKDKYLGSFIDKDEAIAVRIKANQENGYSSRHGTESFACVHPGPNLCQIFRERDSPDDKAKDAEDEPTHEPANSP